MFTDILIPIYWYWNRLHATWKRLQTVIQCIVNSTLFSSLGVFTYFLYSVHIFRVLRTDFIPRIPVIGLSSPLLFKMPKSVDSIEGITKFIAKSRLKSRRTFLVCRCHTRRKRRVLFSIALQKLDKPCQLKVSGSAIYVSGLFEHAQTDDWEAVDCFMDCLSYTMCSYLSE